MKPKRNLLIKNTLAMEHLIINRNGFRKDIERKNNVIDWFNDQKPDVVANEETLLEDAKKWGHNYVVILKDTIICDLKVPFVNCETFGIFFCYLPLNQEYILKKNRYS